MSNARIAKLHTKVFSTPQFSKERERAISALILKGTIWQAALQGNRLQKWRKRRAEL